MAMNFEDTSIVHTNKRQQYSGWDMKPNNENNKLSGGVKRVRKISETTDYNSKIKRPLIEYKCHTHLVDSMKCRYENTKLLVCNLHERVTESDIEMLFNEFGSYKYCKVHYDENGWSLGSADVTFGRKEDAVEAMELYNGSKLDGRVLNIKLIISEYPGSPSGSELSSVNDCGESNSFTEQQTLEQELDALFDEFVKSRCSRSRSMCLM